MSPVQPEGTLVVRVFIDQEWPLSSAVVHKTLFDDGSLTIEVSVGDRVRANLSKDSSQGPSAGFSATTGRIVCLDFPLMLTVGVTWNVSTGMLVYVNGRIAGSTVDPSLFLGTYPCHARFAKESDVANYAEKNARALSRRSGRLLPRLKAKAGTRLGGPNYYIAALSDEIQQLRGLLKLVASGDTAHARGIAGKLRLLLHREGQFPLLQLCAAITHSDLLVFSGAAPEYVSPLEPDLFLTHSYLSGVETDRYFNPVDIDVWLGFPAIKIGPTVLSNEALIADLGNTIGNHLDPNILPSIDTLRAFFSGTSERLEDSLTQHVVGVAQAVVTLGDRVLAKAESLDLIG